MSKRRIYFICCVPLTTGTVNWHTWLIGRARAELWLMKLVVDNATLHNHLTA